MSAFDTNSGPTPRQFTGRFDPILTTIAIRDMQADQNFMAPNVFPIVNVISQGGRYKVWDRGALLRPEMRRKTYGDRPNQGSYKETDASYWCEPWSLEKVVDPNDVNAARVAGEPLAPFEGAVDYLTLNAKLTIDQEWAKVFFNAATWAFNYQGVASNPSNAGSTPEFLQFDQGDAKPAQFIRSRASRMLLLTGRKPNVLVVGENVYQWLCFDEDFVDRVKYVQRGIVDIDLMAQFFDVERVLVAQTVVNDAPEGKDPEYKFIVDPNAMLLAYVAPRPSRDTPSAGYIFNWRGLYDEFKGPKEATANGMAIIRRGYDDRAPADWVQIHTAFGMQATAPDLGMYFEDVIGTDLLAE